MVGINVPKERREAIRAIIGDDPERTAMVIGQLLGDLGLTAHHSMDKLASMVNAAAEVLATERSVQ